MLKYPFQLIFLLDLIPKERNQIKSLALRHFFAKLEKVEKLEKFYKSPRILLMAKNRANRTKKNRQLPLNVAHALLQEQCEVVHAFNNENLITLIVSLINQ